jgi:glyoxylase-like metal-dependent hydrolase (beta-lactamase superfamily II)
MLRLVSAALAVAIMALAGAANAQPRVDFSRVEIKTTDLGNRTYMLEGAGGNITVAVADDGVIMVDGQFAQLFEKIRSAIAALTNQPIRYLVNTHYHGDHTGGNEGFALHGVTITAHANVRSRLAEGTVNRLTGVRTPPAPERALPTKTYKNWITLRLKGRSAILKHPAPAHTDGDTFVHFADANVLATGDIVTVGNRYPNIDFAVGGGIDGMVSAVAGYLKLANDATKIVPGHGPVMNKARLAEYRALLATARDRVAKLIRDGKTVDEAVAARPLADLDAQAGANEQGSANFVRVIYHSLKPAKLGS